MQSDIEKNGSSFIIDPAILLARKLEPALYVVATPIGNLGDITLRALQTLGNVDLIACEDKRITARLLQRFAISSRMIAYHDHNAAKQAPQILDTLEKGQSVALVSDAGTPLISDPGFRLINDVVQAGHKVIPLPGASSPITALSAAGLPTDTFIFAGFLPPKSAARRSKLHTMRDIQATMVFLESPKRLASTLADCRDVLGDEREAVIGRELTKLYETFLRGTLSTLSDEITASETLKGEIVLMIGPPGDRELDQAAVDAELMNLLKTYRVKEAAEMLSKETGLAKRDIYQRALLLKEQENDGK